MTTQVQSLCRDAIDRIHPGTHAAKVDVIVITNSYKRERYRSVILSAAKNPAWRGRFFAALRMTDPNVIGNMRNRVHTPYPERRKTRQTTFRMPFVPLFLNWR